jgi:hypothetical protein
MVVEISTGQSLPAVMLPLVATPATRSRYGVEVSAQSQVPAGTTLSAPDGAGTVRSWRLLADAAPGVSLATVESADGTGPAFTLPAVGATDLESLDVAGVTVRHDPAIHARTVGLDAKNNVVTSARTIHVDALLGDTEVTLESTMIPANTRFTVKRTDQSANTVRIVPNGGAGTIDGSADITLGPDAGLTLAHGGDGAFLIYSVAS